MLNTTDLPHLWRVAAFHRNRAEKASAEFDQLLDESMSPGCPDATRNRRNVLFAIQTRSLLAWSRTLEKIEEIIEQEG